MAELRDIMVYLLSRYPSKFSHDLSNARLTKMIYLSDWLNCLSGGLPISKIDWYFDNHGPFVWDVKKTAEKHPEVFELESTNNMFGAKKTVFSLKSGKLEPILTAREKVSIDKVIEITNPLVWSDFISLVYGTHPIATSERYSKLNLIEKAKEYKRISAI